MNKIFKKKKKDIELLDRLEKKKKDIEFLDILGNEWEIIIIYFVNNFMFTLWNLNKLYFLYIKYLWKIFFLYY